MKRKHLLTLCLCFMVFHSTGAHGQVSQSVEFPYWWQVELRVTTTGEYSYRKDNKGFDGNYSFNTVLLGSVQDDEGGDFIFLQVHQEAKDITWKEVLFNDVSRIENNLNDLAGKIAPELTVNYVFHNKGTLLFDFEYKPLHVPCINSTNSTNSIDSNSPAIIFSKPEYFLRLPESASEELVGKKGKYDKGVILGSNRIIVTDKEITANPSLTRTYEWKWKDKSGSMWKSRHTATVTLKMIRKSKKEAI